MKTKTKITNIEPELKSLRFTLVAAIHFLMGHTLDPHEIISLDCFGHEGYELQAYAREWEGSTGWIGNTDIYANRQFNVLLDILKEDDLCLQFVDSYPVVDDENNLRVLIMTRKRLQEALFMVDRYPAPSAHRKAPLQRVATVLQSHPVSAR